MAKNKKNKKEVKQKSSIITVNINNENKVIIRNGNDFNNIVQAIRDFLIISSEHLYICITQGDVNSEMKWLRTEFSNDHIAMEAKNFIGISLGFL